MARQMIDIGLVSVPGGEDVAVADGDFVLVESSNVHGEQLILNNKGEFKENPTICVGAWDFLDAIGPSGLLNEISRQFQGDGVDVTQVGISTGAVGEPPAGNIVVTGHYK